MTMVKATDFLGPLDGIRTSCEHNIYILTYLKHLKHQTLNAPPVSPLLFGAEQVTEASPELVFTERPAAGNKADESGENEQQTLKLVIENQWAERH